ncbi:MAG: hypothetical protein ABF617_00760 [Gluconobacter japonicus]|uniref:hypothetical protein n=1 Tax=Gluconobacter japonicus TaxID=376620 RepID=UPI0039EA038B
MRLHPPILRFVCLHAKSGKDEVSPSRSRTASLRAVQRFDEGRNGTVGSGNMTHPGKAVTRRNAGKIPFMLLLAAPLFTACQHQDAVDVPAGWWHSFEGGEIAKLRPPPPGQNLPYPHVGRTPAQNPEMPSPEARVNLTMQLEAQRNLAQRESAAQGTLPTIPPPPPKTAPSAVNPTGTEPEEQNNLTMTSVGQPADTTPPINAAPGAAPGTPAPATPSKTPQPTTPEAELPPVVAAAIPPTPPGEFPQIGALPPPPPQFPGFDLPRDANLTGPLRPDIDTSTPEGTLIRFQPSTDHVVGDPSSDYQRIISQRGDQKITILGFGAAMSADAGLSTADQGREIALGLLRARTVAHALIQRGVPASAIVLRAEAIGNGVRVRNGG